MALPAKRQAKSRSRTRRSAIKLSRVSLTLCSKCQRPIRPHHACAFCGIYQGREVIKIKLSKKEKKIRKQQEKEIKKK